MLQKTLKYTVGKVRGKEDNMGEYIRKCFVKEMNRTYQAEMSEEKA